MTTDRKRVIGYDQDYPGSYRWPIYEILCPECKKWSKDYGNVTVEIDDEDIPLCEKCGDEIFPPNTN